MELKSGLCVIWPVVLKEREGMLYNCGQREGGENEGEKKSGQKENEEKEGDRVGRGGRGSNCANSTFVTVWSLCFESQSPGCQVKCVETRRRTNAIATTFKSRHVMQLMIKNLTTDLGTLPLPGTLLNVWLLKTRHSITYE